MIGYSSSSGGSNIGNGSGRNTSNFSCKGKRYLWLINLAQCHEVEWGSEVTDSRILDIGSRWK
jgi:hypothetical protein